MLRFDLSRSQLLTPYSPSRCAGSRPGPLVTLVYDTPFCPTCTSDSKAGIGRLVGNKLLAHNDVFFLGARFLVVPSNELCVAVGEVIA